MPLLLHIVKKNKKGANRMEEYQTPQVEEEIKRLREISDENQKKVNSGVFAAEKTDQVSETRQEGEPKSRGIWQGILFLIMAAILLGQARGNETVTQVMNQIGKTIQQIGEKVEEKEWFSFGEKETEEKETQGETK